MLKHTLSLLFIATLLAGCHSYSPAQYGADFSADAAIEARPLSEAGGAGLPEQMLIWTGSISIEVVSITNASAQITVQAEAAGGYIESTSRYESGEGPTATMVVRIPADRLGGMVDSMGSLGEVTAQSLSSQDVTELYIDMQARLGTKKKLRDRLQNLLDRADEVKDILAIEKELTRLQADIDSMTARLKAMKGKVDYASLTVQLKALKHEKVLGPLGYVWKGAEWCVTKLFVWKDETYEQQ
ncbi:DUF4349 domain-containing protein [Pontiella agarivorans]|uniref:DUF4349 domain-containing protein n=1 Tax=Pontiella agarivorans TaxID=3038953 RepID=A0ABU5MVB1_9BACT|nr:DUF4349 domain-containing protein [Pontiella agarivorans]MDZ8118102.1 DUF4349 domain-containing protein [Pontiella agarivorans]